jgi:hypothetical protein
MRVRDMDVLQGKGFGTHWSELPGRRFKAARRMSAAVVDGVVIGGIKVPLTITPESAAPSWR